MKVKRPLAPSAPIERMIYTIRGHRVMLDADLARIYGVPTKVLNQAVKRNSERFPPDFVFQLAHRETEHLRYQTGNSGLRSQIVTSKGRGGRRYFPYAFTEHGAIMAANVLNSARAVTMSVYVVRAFVKLREMLAANKELAGKLKELERKLTARLDGHEKAITHLFTEIRELLTPPPKPRNRRIGFR